MILILKIQKSHGCRAYFSGEGQAPEPVDQRIFTAIQDSSILHLDFSLDSYVFRIYLAATVHWYGAEYLILSEPAG